MPQVVHLTETSAVSVSTVVNRTDFNVYKNVSNQVEFLFKTVDRKPVSFPSNPSIFIVDCVSNQLVITQPLIMIDATRGHYRLILDPSKVGQLEVGYFQYVVTTADSSGNQNVIYTDQNRSTRGYFELFEGPLPEPIAATVIGLTDFVAMTWGIPPLQYFVAQSYPGAAQRNNVSGRHTIALYTTAFSGVFEIQASLENSAPTVDDQWFDVSTTTLTAANGVNSIQFEGNYMWLRFILLPNPTNTGTFEKALLRN